MMKHSRILAVAMTTVCIALPPVAHAFHIKTEQDL